jgi:hypothetical protein
MNNDIIENILKEVRSSKSFTPTHSPTKKSKPLPVKKESKSSPVKKESKPAPVKELQNTDESSVGLVLNELIDRIKTVENSIDQLKGSVTTVIQEKTNYKFSIKRDSQGQIESVIANTEG